MSTKDMIRRITEILEPHLGEGAEDRARNLVQAMIYRDATDPEPAEMVRSILEDHFEAPCFVEAEVHYDIAEIFCP